MVTKESNLIAIMEAEKLDLNQLFMNDIETSIFYKNTKLESIKNIPFIDHPTNQYEDDYTNQRKAAEL